MKISELTVQYSGVREIFTTYWRIYGGFSDLFLSPYFHVSLIFSLLLFPLWTNPGWWDDVISVTPSIIGFSLGGYAIWLAMGDETFRSLMCGEEDSEDSSPYMDINAAFVHFILIQFLSLFIALLGKAYYSFGYVPTEYYYIGTIHIPIADIYNKTKFVFSFIGYFVFIYALMSAIAATFAILRYSTWYDQYITGLKNKNNNG